MGGGPTAPSLTHALQGSPGWARGETVRSPGSPGEGRQGPGAPEQGAVVRPRQAETRPWNPLRSPRRRDRPCHLSPSPPSSPPSLAPARVSPAAQPPQEERYPPAAAPHGLRPAQGPCRSFTYPDARRGGVTHRPQLSFVSAHGDALSNRLARKRVGS